MIIAYDNEWYLNLTYKGWAMNAVGSAQIFNPDGSPLEIKTKEESKFLRPFIRESDRGEYTVISTKFNTSDFPELRTLIESIAGVK